MSTIAAQLQKSLQSRLRTGSQPRAQPLCGGTQGDNGRPEGRAGRQSLELEIQEGQLGAGEREHLQMAAGFGFTGEIGKGFRQKECCPGLKTGRHRCVKPRAWHGPGECVSWDPTPKTLSHAKSLEPCPTATTVPHDLLAKEKKKVVFWKKKKQNLLSIMDPLQMPPDTPPP